MNILHIDSSPRLISHSRALSAKIVKKILEFAPDAHVFHRDLGLHPAPHASCAYATALASPETLAATSFAGAMQLSEQLIGEVEAADIVVIGTPMNNFTVPSVLKAWLDQILRVGRTICPTPDGKVGMLRDRPVFVGIAAGGVFSGDLANQPDFLTPYLSVALGCIGLKTIQFLPLQATAFISALQAEEAINTLASTIDMSTGLLRCAPGLAGPHHQNWADAGHPNCGSP